jgi:hypothetical protein
VDAVGEPGVEPQLIRRREAKPGGRLVAGDVVELDPVEALRGAAVDAPPKQRPEHAQPADVEPALARPALHRPPDHGRGEAGGVGPPPFPRAGVDIADHAAAQPVEAGDERRRRLEHVDVIHLGGD